MPEIDQPLVWLITSISLLVLIIGCQAALNLWFVIRSLDLTQNTSQIAALTAELKKQSMDRMDELRTKIDKLEAGVSARLDANVALLEKLVLTKHHYDE